MSSVIAPPPTQIGSRKKPATVQYKPNGYFNQIKYPESDGKPMADNTKQFNRVVKIEGGVASIYTHDPNVFVAGDLLWYPVEGDNRISAAPDVMVVFGRPKGDRGSYLQWLENDIPPQVVFEILSPSNTVQEMRQKFRFYERYGVEEYYVYDPDTGDLEGWLRSGDSLHPIAEMDGWVSPRLGIRFELDGIELNIYRPDGRRFETYEELNQHFEQERQRAEQEYLRAEQERQRAEEAHLRAEQALQRAEQALQRAEEEGQRAEQAMQHAERERQRAERLAARLAELGVAANGESVSPSSP